VFTVKNSILFLVLLLAAAWALALGDKGGKKAPSTKVVDAGSFGVFMNGKRIATEKFHIEQGADIGTITSEIKLDDGTTKAEQTAEMHVAANGELRLYKWRSTVPNKEESVIEPKNEFLVEHLTGADQKKRDVPYILPLSTVVLDDNFFSQRELLIWRYLASGCVPKENQLACGPSHFGILVPRQHLATNTTVELLGRDTITTLKGAARELNKIKLDADGVSWLIWVDDDYKVLKMSIPSGHVEVWRD
jgi:hypothetical protein